MNVNNYIHTFSYFLSILFPGWILVDLLTDTSVGGMKVQHRGDQIQYVTQLTLSVSKDSTVWVNAEVSGNQVSNKELYNH